MSTQIRRAVFETNSSSSHSLTLGRAALVRPPLSTAQARDGVIGVELGEYGWDRDTFYGFDSKLSYLVSQLASELQVNYSMASDDAHLKLEADPRMIRLRSVVRGFTGAEIEVARTNGYVDHQSVGITNEVFADDQTLRQFLFDETSHFETDNDNDYD